jgi:hypothetical protein
LDRKFRIIGVLARAVNMRKRYGLATALLLAAAAATAGQAVRPALPVDAAADEAARFISGLPCASEPWKRLQETAEWKAFVERLEKSWADLEAKRLVPMRKWAADELVLAGQETRTVFYPFGGPDLLTPLLLFPNADTYVLLGLEFVGHLPDFEKAAPENLQAYFDDMGLALSDFLNKSYFITRNMDATLYGDKVEGVLPLLAFFLKREGFTISSVKRVDILENGELMESDLALARKARRPYGAKIEFFAEGTDRLRTVTYFSADLVDTVFRKDSPFHIGLDGLTFETTYIKSASYLPHYKEFSNIRNLILAKSRFVLEDDTGVPFRYFPPAEWASQLYGEYIEPVSDFKGVGQEDLRAAYADPSRVKPLPFHLGYHWGTNKDSVLFFRKK